MAKLDMKTRNKIFNDQRMRYKKATKKEKGIILDSVCLTTGLSRDRAKKLFAENPKHPPISKSGRSGRNRKYGQKTREALKTIWVLMDCAGGKRLCAGMKDLLFALARCGECGFDENTQAQLLEISPATADRILKREKEKMRFKGKSTTKPGTLLKKNIPIRLGTEWDEDMPGFVECDLVAHCGATTAGEYVNTLDVTDIKSGWTETRAVINKAQKHVFDALMDIESDMPFTILGIDSGNGSEFINHHLYRYCREQHIAFTRSRPYMKNDGCHVEQKNWHIVRHHIGYGRYEGRNAVRIINEYYALLRLYTNFFSPQAKLISKRREGNRFVKRYDDPKTPYRRLLADEAITDETKNQLKETFMSLNPAAIKRGMIKLLDTLMKLTVPS